MATAKKTSAKKTTAKKAPPAQASRKAPVAKKASASPIGQQDVLPRRLAPEHGPRITMELLEIAGDERGRAAYGSKRSHRSANLGIHRAERRTVARLCCSDKVLALALHDKAGRKKREPEDRHGRRGRQQDKVVKKPHAFKTSTAGSGFTSLVTSMRWTGWPTPAHRSRACVLWLSARRVRAPDSRAATARLIWLGVAAARCGRSDKPRRQTVMRSVMFL
jgi:hypothetical protein